MQTTCDTTREFSFVQNLTGYEFTDRNLGRTKAIRIVETTTNKRYFAEQSLYSLRLSATWSSFFAEISNSFIDLTPEEAQFHISAIRSISEDVEKIY
jgi:hypothetical protein